MESSAARLPMTLGRDDVITFARAASLGGQPGPQTVSGEFVRQSRAAPGAVQIKA